MPRRVADDRQEEGALCARPAAGTRWGRWSSHGMAEPFADPDADLSLDVYAAQLRLHHRDAAAQTEALAARVEQLVPHLTAPPRAGGRSAAGR